MAEVFAYCPQTSRRTLARQLHVLPQYTGKVYPIKSKTSSGTPHKHSPTGIHGTFPSSISTSNSPPRPPPSPLSTPLLCRYLPCGYSCSYRNSTSDGGRSVKCFSPRTTQYMFCKQWGGLGRRKVGGWGPGAGVHFGKTWGKTRTDEPLGVQMEGSCA